MKRRNALWSKCGSLTKSTTRNSRVEGREGGKGFSEDGAQITPERREDSPNPDSPRLPGQSRPSRIADRSAPPYLLSDVHTLKSHRRELCALTDYAALSPAGRSSGGVCSRHTQGYSTTISSTNNQALRPAPGRPAGVMPTPLALTRTKRVSALTSSAENVWTRGPASPCGTA